VAARTFRIFISSTFGDLAQERNALQDRVFPALRRFCAGRGARFQAVDLRWGISQDAAEGQDTMRICLAEIDRCRQVTPRPNFVLLLGDRYGWRPLPFEIPKDEFETLLACTPASAHARLCRRYREDLNALDRRYVLQPRGPEFGPAAVWEREEQEVRAMLLAAAETAGLPPGSRAKYVESATGQEVAKGVLDLPDTAGHVFCFFRTIRNLPSDGSGSGYAEAEAGARRALDALKTRLREKLGDSVREYEAHWTEDGITSDHLNRLCQDVHDCLAGVIGEELAWVEQDAGEADAHERFREMRDRRFTGRGSILRRIETYRSDAAASYPLVVFGPAGSGKSAVIARAVGQARGEHPFVFRFIGATAESSRGPALLEGLCREIDRCYGREAPVPSGYDELLGAFSARLALAVPKQPLVLFLDALDQLAERDEARDLAWLPRRVPPHVRIIVSTSPELLPVMEGTLPKESFVELEPMPLEDGERLLDAWLTDAGRTLQPAQRNLVRDRFSTSGLPLYLRLAFEEARLWRSWDPVPPLGATIAEIIGDLFARLSLGAAHGRALVARSLGLLAAARNGLTEDELLDLLSADTEVMAEFRDRSPFSPATDRLPAVVWSRFYFDLAPYLAERSGDGASLIGFYHRELGQAARERYLAGRDGPERHRQLAAYFALQELGTPSAPNLRKLSELPYQQARGGTWDALQETLTGFAFLHAKTAAAGAQPLIDDYDFAASAPPPIASALRAVQSTLRLSAAVAAGDPAQLAAQLLGRLGADASEPIRRLLDEADRWRGAPWLRPLTRSLAAPGGSLVRTIRTHGFVNAVAPIPGARRAISASSDGSLRIWDLETWAEVRTLAGHAASVRGLAVTPDGRLAASASEDSTLKVWSLADGALLHTLRGHGAPVVAVAVAAGGELAVSASEDRTLKVWDLASGAEVRTLAGHNGAVRGVAAAGGARRVVSCSEDRTLRLWDLDTGQPIRVFPPAHHGAIIGVAVSPDGRLAISASEDQTMIVWDLEHERPLLRLAGHGGPVAAVAITGDGRRAASASFDATVKLWDLTTGTQVATFAGHGQWVTAVAMSPGEDYVLSGSDDATIKIWDLRVPPLFVPALAITPDGRTAVSSTPDAVLKIWDLERGAERLNLRSGAGFVAALDDHRVLSETGTDALSVLDLETGAESGLAPMPDAGRVLAVSPDGRSVIREAGSDLSMHDLGTGARLRTFTGHRGPVLAATFTPDGRRAVSISADNTRRIWDAVSGSELSSRSSRGIRSIAVLSDGRRLLSADAGGAARITDLETGDDLITARFGVFPQRRFLRSAGKVQIEIPGEPVRAVAAARDCGRSVLAAQDGTVRVWDGEAEHMVLPGHVSEITAAAVLPDGSRALTASSDGVLKIWDLNTGTLRRTLRDPAGGFGAVPTPDGRRAIVAGGTGVVRVWDLETGGKIREFGPHLEAITAFVLIDAQHLLYASDQGLFRTWDLKTATETACFPGPGCPASSLAVLAGPGLTVASAFGETIALWDLERGAQLWARSSSGDAPLAVAALPDGSALLAGYAGGSIRLLAREDGAELGRLEGHTNWIQMVRALPDGATVLSAAWDNTFRVWDLAGRRPLAVFAGDQPLRACDGAPDGEHFLAGDAAGRLHFLRASAPLR
jgi:WD40 repeat protein